MPNWFPGYILNKSDSPQNKKYFVSPQNIKTSDQFFKKILCFVPEPYKFVRSHAAPFPCCPMLHVSPMLQAPGKWPN